LATTTDRKSFFNRLGGKAGNERAEMTFFDHIEELRWHLLRSVIAWLIAAIFIFIYKDWVYDNLILAPAEEGFYTYGALCRLGHFLHLGDSLCMPPVQIDLQVNTVNGTFTSALNIATIGGLLIALPYILWELWRFIKPALSPKERKYGTGSVFWISFCFFLGGLFGYYILAPFTFNFLAGFKLGTQNMVQYRPTITDYIDSLTNLILGCGIAFELPVICYVLAKLGLISGTFLKKYFKFAIVIILAVAAIITPSPDWISQFIVALPLFVLYWISILLASRVERKKEEQEKKEWS
jgi:sec-independent protein translocase protein TatC